MGNAQGYFLLEQLRQQQQVATTTTGSNEAGGTSVSPTEGQVPVFPTGGNRMKLTHAEREIARAIKSQVQQIPELEPLSDFMYAQIAIVTILQGENRSETIIERIQNLQHAREEYRVLDTYKDGKQILSRMLLPTQLHHLSFSYSPQDNTYAEVADLTKFDATILTNEERTNLWMASEYYIKHAQSPDFTAIRDGLTIMVETEGYEWRNPNHLNMKATRMLANIIANYYPFHTRATKFYHTGVFVNLFVSTCRKLVPSLLSKTYEVGCQFSGGRRLDEIFLLPTPEIARRRLVTSLQEGLRIRYQNEATFSLVEDDNDNHSNGGRNNGVRQT